MQFKKDLKLVYRIGKYTRPYIPMILFIIILTGVDIISNILIAKGQQIFIDTIHSGSKAYLLFLIKISLAAIFLIPALTFVGDYLKSYLPLLARKDLAGEVFDHLNRIPLKSLENKPTGDLVYRASRNVFETTSFTLDSLTKIIYNIGLFIVSFFYLTSMDPLLAVLVICTGPITFLAGRFLDSRIRKTALAEKNQGALVRGFLQEVLQGIQEVKHFSLQELFNKRYDQLLSKENEMIKKKTFYTVIMNQITLTLNDAMTMTLIYFAGLSVLKGHLSVGGIIAFIYLLGLIQEPFVGISTIYGKLLDGLSAAERVFELLDVKQESFAKDTELADLSYLLNRAEYVIEFEKVHFKHNQGEQSVLFEDLNLKVKRGETVALVGASGSGKSTLARLCSGLYEPDKGSIKIFGLDVSENRHKIRSLIAYVGHPPYLFTDSIQENISLGSKKSLAEITEAGRAAGCEEFVGQMKDGYQHQLTEQGANLSGGQKQRIALARAFSKEAPLLILDEPTSSLDKTNSENIRLVIERLMEQKTTRAALIITHDLSLTENISKIIVLDQGKIVETGTHQDLLSKEGYYAKLYNYQFQN